MKWLNTTLFLAVLLPANAAWAQLAAPNNAGVSMGHFHLIVSDVPAAQRFWMALGATPVKFGNGEAMKFPGVLVLLRKGEPTGGTQGSVVNHIGFTVPNVQESVAKWKAAGLHVEPGNNRHQAYVYTPDNLVKIEILETPSLPVPIASHHVHFYVDEASIPKIQAWYAKIFGAIPGKREPFEADDVPGINLSFSKSDTPAVPTKGRALDHIGFEVNNLEAFCKKLEAEGVNFDVPYTERPDLGISLAYITDPWGTRIELTEGLNKL